eukprot:scaffold159455_cov30-Tisochrysis_lutea.AAC.1
MVVEEVVAAVLPGWAQLGEGHHQPSVRVGPRVLRPHKPLSLGAAQASACPSEAEQRMLDEVLSRHRPVSQRLSHRGQQLRASLSRIRLQRHPIPWAVATQHQRAV